MIIPNYARVVTLILIHHLIIVILTDSKCAENIFFWNLITNFTRIACICSSTRDLFISSIDYSRLSAHFLISNISDHCPAVSFTDTPNNQRINRDNISFSEGIMLTTFQTFRSEILSFDSNDALKTDAFEDDNKYFMLFFVKMYEIKVRRKRWWWWWCWK